MRIQDIADLVKGELKLIKGNISGDFEIEALAAMPSLAEEKQLALVFPASFNKANRMLKGSQAHTLLVSDKLAEDVKFLDFLNSREEDAALIIVKRPKFALKEIMPSFTPERYKPSGIHPSAVIEESAKVDPLAKVGALAYIGPEAEIGPGSVIHARVSIGKAVKLGENCEIHSGVVIEDYCELQDRVIIHPNSTIGADGYSYITEEPTNLEKMRNNDFNLSMERQIQHKIECAGNVVIESDVEIGANTCVDRGNIGPTRVGEGTKIDNLCQIAHNVQIGKDCLVISQTGIAGSAKIQDRVTIAGACGIGDGVEIGNDAVVGAFSAVNSDIDQFMPVIGIPAIAYGEFMKRQRALGKINKSQDDLRKLKTKVDELSKKV